MLIPRLIFSYLFMCIMTLFTGILINIICCLVRVLPYGTTIYSKYLSFGCIVHELCHLFVGIAFGFYPTAIQLTSTNNAIAHVTQSPNYNPDYTGWFKWLELTRIRTGVIITSLAPVLIMPVLALSVLKTALNATNPITKIILLLFWVSLVIECRPSKQDWQNAGVEL